MREKAKQYYRQGANIVLVKGKKPVHEWERWQTERQSENDFSGLPWNNADGFALIGGSKLENGLFLCAVDWDVKNVNEEVKELGTKILKKIRITQIEETPSGGQHWIYLSREKPGTISAYHNECAVELLGENKLIIMAPSSGYKRLNDNPFTVVKNLEDVFYKALRSVGVKVKEPVGKRKFWFDREDFASKPYRKKHPLCIVSLLKGVSEGLRNEAAIRLAAYFVNFRHNKNEKAWNILVKWNQDNSPPLEDKELQSIFESTLKHSYVFGCSDSILNSQCTSKVECPIGVKTLQPQELIRYELEKSKAVKLHPLIDYYPGIGLVIGSLLGEASQSLLFVSKKPFICDFDNLKIEEEISKDISISRPKFAFLNKIHNAEILLLAANYFESEQIEFPTKTEVFEKVLGGMKQYWWISDERYYIAVACWIIGTYFHPIFVYYPILALQGLRETGKTTLLELLRKMCWNPTGREVALREAGLFRTVQDARVTYLADITKLNPRSKNYADVIDVFETGTEKGGCVRRIDKDTREPLNYLTFGPKAIATRYDLPFTPKTIQIITEKAPTKVYSARRAKLEFDFQWPNVVRCLVKSAIKYSQEVVEAYASVEQTDKLMGRSFNYWASILSICKVFAPNQYAHLLKLAEEEAERMEKGDFLSDVEEAVLTVLLGEAYKTEHETITIPLKELTEKATEICPLIKSWHIVKSAVKNLRIMRRRPYSQSGKGIMYQLDLKKAKTIAEERSVVLAQPTQETSETVSLDDLVSVHWSDSFYSKKVCGVCGYEKYSSWQGETNKRAKIPVCDDCAQEYNKRRGDA